MAINSEAVALELETQEIETAMRPPEHIGNKSRDLVLDNAKGICVLMVVTLHQSMITKVGKAPFFLGVVPVMTLVVMPTFSFAAGFVSSPDLNLRRAAKLLRLVVVFGLQRLIVMPFAKSESTNAWGFWNEPGIHWFLFAILLWRLVLPLLVRLRYPTRTTLILSMLMGITDSGSNAFVHTSFSYLPFFMLGYRTPASTLSRIRIHVIRAPFLASLFGSMILSVTPQGLPTSNSARDLAERTIKCMLNHRLINKEDLQCYEGWGLLRPVGFFMASFVMMFSFLACIPTEEFPACRFPVVTVSGLMSLHIYLLHILLGLNGMERIFALAGKGKEFDERMNAIGTSWFGVPFTLGLSLFLWTLLSLPCSRTVFRPLLEPKCECCILRDDEASLCKSHLAQQSYC